MTFLVTNLEINLAKIFKKQTHVKLIVKNQSRKNFIDQFLI